MQKFSIMPSEMFGSVWRHRNLIGKMIKREVVGRYRGSFLGIFWSFFNPIFMLSVYTFIFTVVFQARWTGGTDSRIEFALLLFAGLIVFNLFSECINRAPNLILSNVNYVKKVIFPLEVLPWISLGSALFHSFISLIVWLLAYLLSFGLPHPTIVLIPVIIFPLLLLIIGISWILASLGVYLRDISQAIIIITTALMFMSPIFYPVASLPALYQPIFMLNPLTPVIEQSRAVLFWGTNINWHIYFLYTAASFLISWIGFAWFQKTRQGFADVI